MLVSQSIDCKWFRWVLVLRSNWTYDDGHFFDPVFKYSWLSITPTQSEVLDWRGFCAFGLDRFWARVAPLLLGKSNTGLFVQQWQGQQVPFGDDKQKSKPVQAKVKTLLYDHFVGVEDLVGGALAGADGGVDCAPVASSVGVLSGEVEGVGGREGHFGAGVDGSGRDVAVGAVGEGVALPVMGVAAMSWLRRWVASSEKMRASSVQAASPSCAEVKLAKVSERGPPTHPVRVLLSAGWVSTRREAWS